MERILVALDGSAESEQILDHVVRIARHDARIDLLHVLPMFNHEIPGVGFNVEDLAAILGARPDDLAGHVAAPRSFRPAPPGAPPDWPPAANITPGDNSAMTQYKDSSQFIAMLRSGKRPDGTPIKVMPFESLSKMSDVDTQALYEYLKTVQPRKAGGR